MLKTLFLGIIQGLSEFLPISSSGHLVLFQRLMNMPDTGLLMEILLHVGSLTAVLFVFFQDWVAMLRHILTSKPLRLLIVATIPATLVALFFNDLLEAAFGGWFLGVSFLITAAMLFAAESLARRAKRTGLARKGDIDHMGYDQAFAMGVMQAVALVPGISRSGSTIVGGLWSGVTRQTAAKFSFMMSAVAILGSLVFKAKDLLDVGFSAFEGGMGAALVGMVAAAISSFLAIRWMLRLITKISLKWFGLYTALLGILVLADQLFFGLVLDKIL